MLIYKVVAQNTSSDVPLQTCFTATFLLSHLTMQYGNLDYHTYAYDWHVEEAAAELRKHLVNIIVAHSREFIFTAGATEVMNVVVKGVA